MTANKTTSRPFLLLQLRPETTASDDEYAAFLGKGGLSPDETVRMRLDQQDLPTDIDLDAYAGVIVGGGPGCVSDPPAKKSAVETRIEQQCLAFMPEIIERDIPFLGACYGIGILAHYLGATVSKERFSEPVGTSACAIEHADPLLDGVPRTFDAFVGHKEAVQSLPMGATHLVSSPTCPIQMIRVGDNVYATQFHPEADAAVFETRIEVYRDYGYFPPETAAQLIEECRAANVTAPQRILSNFVRRYRTAPPRR
ncbi:MAG: glutamine amidotransferase [Nostocoides sp.]